jgi:hypothetical protein
VLIVGTLLAVLAAVQRSSVVRSVITLIAHHAILLVYHSVVSTSADMASSMVSTSAALTSSVVSTSAALTSTEKAAEV